MSSFLLHARINDMCQGLNFYDKKVLGGSHDWHADSQQMTAVYKVSIQKVDTIVYFSGWNLIAAYQEKE